MLCGIYLPSVVYNFVVIAQQLHWKLIKTDQRYNIMEINKTNFCILWTLKFKTIILICVHTKTLKFHKPSVRQDLKMVEIWSLFNWWEKHLSQPCCNGKPWSHKIFKANQIAVPPFLLGSWAFYQIFKKGGLTGSQFLVGVSVKERGDFF